MTGFFWKRLCRLCLAVVPWPFEHVMWPGRYCICSCTLLLFNSPSMVATLQPTIGCMWDLQSSVLGLPMPPIRFVSPYSPLPSSSSSSSSCRPRLRLHRQTWTILLVKHSRRLPHQRWGEVGRQHLVACPPGLGTLGPVPLLFFVLSHLVSSRYFGFQGGWV